MAALSNVLAPTGLSFTRNFFSGANTYQQNLATIKVGYGTNIAVGDLVKIGTGAQQGYVNLSTLTDTTSLGVFGGILAYYDQTLQATFHGLNGAYQSTLNPAADISCVVVMDPGAVFACQVSAPSNAFAQSWVGQNINFLTATNGAANAAGRSTLALDFTTLGTSNTLPFRIVGPWGFIGGPQDPTNNNPWVEVRLNTTAALQATGI